MAKDLSVLETSLLKNINKRFGEDNPMVQLTDDGEWGKPRGFISTGVYSLNWLISGDLNGGYPVGRITEMDGDPGTGKSLLCEIAMKDPTIDLIIYLDTEAAMNIEFVKFLGVDPEKILYQPIDTVEQIQDVAEEVLNTIVMNKQQHKKILMIIDSIALASTEKEMDPEGGCYTGNTVVHTANGKKKIKDIKIGDKVLTHLSKFANVENIYTFDTKEQPELIELELENGEIIKLTPTHKILTKELKWIEAQNLTENDEIMRLDI